MKHEVSMHVALGLRLTALGVKNHEIALQRYESFLNKKQSSPPNMCEKRVWRDDQERDLRGSVESPQCVFGRVGGQVFFCRCLRHVVWGRSFASQCQIPPEALRKFLNITVLR